MYFDPRLWPFIRGARLRIAGAAAVGLLSVLAGIARLVLLGWLLGQVFEGRAAAELALPVALVAAVMVLRGALEYWRAMIAHRTAAKVQLEIRERVYDAIARLGPAYFGQKRTGAAVVTMIDGVEQLETYFGRYLPQLFVAAVTPVAMFAVVAFLDLPVAALMCAFALFALLAPSLLQHWDRKSSRAHTKAHREFGSEFVDALQGLATLKAFGESRARGRLLAERAHALFRSTMWVLATSTLTRGVTDFGIVAGAAATLGLGTLRVAQGEMSLTALLIILMLGTEVFRPLRDLRAVMHAGMLGRSAAKGLAGILEARPVVADVGPDNDPEPSTLAPTIAFDDVTFSYPGGRRPAHEGLSFSVAAGERVGIVGPSGAGKSTILRLLQRLYDPQAGSVRIGGRDLRSLNLDQVRAQLAVVGQDTYLFHGTVEENLRVGKPEATAEELRAAARAANAEEFISRLPHGYGTVVGEKGIRLSGGQRQRVAIARALLRDAPILVLDEALSSVDAENEAVIQQALDRLIEGRTTLVLAHRLSSVISADRILALEDGRVAESGTHGELMAREGAYHRLMVSQAGRRGEETLGHDLADTDPAPVVLDAESDRKDDRAGGADDIVPAEGMGWIAAAAALLRLIAPRRGQFTLTLFLGIARVFAFIGVGAISALTVAAVKAGAPTGWLLILLAVTAPVAAVLHWLESWTAHDMAYRLLSRLRIDLFEKLDRLAPAYLVRRRTGDLVGLATDDVERVEYFFAHTVAPAFVAVLVPAVVLGTLAVHGPALAVGLMPFLTVVGLSPFVMRRRVDALGSRAREALGELNAHAVDTIQGLDVILAFQHVRSRRDEFTRRIRAYHSVRLPFFRDLTLQTAAVDVATGLGGLVVVVTGAMLVGAGAVDSGVLPLLTLLAMAAFLPVSEIAEVSRQLADTLGATRRLTAIHREPVAVTDGPGVTRRHDGGAASLVLEDVVFTYPGTSQPALAGVSFEVAAGATVALVGPSGAGKTTTAHLLVRFWDPQHGKLLLDGHDLRAYRLDELRRHVALVAQDTYLFNQSLCANIRVARPDATEAEVRAAVEKAALGDFVASLPDGLDTVVGERGARLSGGQRQRVAIARAFLRDAPLLVLDEATSHLDAVSERLVYEALDALMRDRTTVVIAHRLSTVRDADRIVVLDRGRVAETGAHVELLARRGLYARLVSHQLGAATAGAADRGPAAVQVG